MRVEIKKMGINGEGIGYLGSKKPVFVDGAFPSEVVEIEIKDETKTYAKGELKKVVRPSKFRVNRACKDEKCKSCSLMGLHPKAQVEEKREVVCQALFKYAHIRKDKIERIRYNEDLFQYRNQIKMPLHEVDDVLKCGLFLPNSNIFTPVPLCKVHDDGIEKMRREIEGLFAKRHAKGYNRKSKKGLRTLVLRHLGDKYQCTLVTGNEELDKQLVKDIMNLPGMVSVGQSINTLPGGEVYGSPVKIIAGDEYLPFTFDGFDLRISNQSFFQLNTKQAKNLYDEVYKMLAGEHYGRIVEAYSGIGVISLKLASLADEIIGIENIPSAVKNAEMNAELNHISNATFICGDAGKEIVKLADEKHIDVIVADPPRTGLSDEFIDCVLQSNASKMVYVSCNLSTLGKDLEKLQQKYDVVKIVPFDMFSHTAHVENVCLLVRR